MPFLTDDELVQRAWEARSHSCSPYSGFAVGAALETAEGRVYTGCNVESSSYGLTCCAERVALFKALSDGERQFRRVAVVTGAPKVCPPCGACRQVLADYAPGIAILMANESERLASTLDELFPFGFDQNFLARP
jgi:cytidine deaminase